MRHTWSSPDTSPLENVPIMVTDNNTKVLIDLFLGRKGATGTGWDDADTTATMGSNQEETQSAHYTSSLLIHLREDNKDLRHKMGRIHMQEKMIMCVIKYWAK